MRFFKYFTPIFISLFLIVSWWSCQRQNRPVVPYEIDSDEIFKPLEANEDNDLQGLVFGKENIPGIIFDYEMETNDSNVYVFFPNFNLLDINPAINQNIFDFISSQMKENDFLNEGFQVPQNFYVSLLEEGKSYSQAAECVLDSLKTGFDAQLKNLGDTSTPFNMVFRIYPVFLDEKYVTFRLLSYNYTGGAHGMTFSYLKTYDLESGKLLTLDDIVKPEGLPLIREEVAAKMAYSYPIYENITTVEQYIDSLNVWVDNFDEEKTDKITLKNYPLTDPGITSEGLVFIYQMYDLTPGSDGCPVVLLPYNEIKGCLFISIP